jgi:hypothetical protein
MVVGMCLGISLLPGGRLLQSPTPPIGLCSSAAKANVIIYFEQ